MGQGSPGARACCTVCFGPKSRKLAEHFAQQHEERVRKLTQAEPERLHFVTRFHRRLPRSGHNGWPGTEGWTQWMARDSFSAPDGAGLGRGQSAARSRISGLGPRGSNMIQRAQRPATVLTHEAAWQGGNLLCYPSRVDVQVAGADKPLSCVPVRTPHPDLSLGGLVLPGNLSSQGGSGSWQSAHISWFHLARDSFSLPAD